MGLTVEWAHTPESVVVTADGDVDASTATRFKEAVAQARESGDYTDVYLDLNRVTFLDSAGLAALVEVASQCHNADQKLRLVCTTRTVLNPIKLTGLEQVFTIVDSLP
ncbi:STAS domain-containing protein [Amycolatopsis sp.]|uniref:STAS domain-containing protein n=1 Tax=Amycolatopsis sp. TaxID=37632 RepID=UPI002BC0EE6B|nr:STAS domain-containing protein [Amycolatopsis sp.]HVV12785.1 STAS domain-containing protein [Amycolatopsis sp.]